MQRSEKHFIKIFIGMRNDSTQRVDGGKSPVGFVEDSALKKGKHSDGRFSYWNFETVALNLDCWNLIPGRNG
jgi:hypothetical protein